MSRLNFLSPWFLLGALAVAIPLVLHLLRQRVDPVMPFSAVRFLRAAPVERARRRRLRDVLLFLLRVTAILLLATAFARPYFTNGATVTAAPVTVVLADVSASLSGDARTARLRSLVQQAVDAAPLGHVVALIQFAARADVLVAPTPDRGSIRAAVAQLVPGYGATSYRAGLARAAETIGERSGRVVVVTDLQTGGWGDGPRAILPSGTAVEVVDVGALPPDLDLSSLVVSERKIVAQVRNTGPARRVEVSFEVNGASAGVQRVGVGANAATDVALGLPVPANARVRARIIDPGGLPADDERWAVRSVRPRPRVTVIVSPGASQLDGLYVERALEALDGTRALDVTTKTADRLNAVEDLRGAAVAILIGTAGMDRHGAEALAKFAREGGGVLVAIGPGINPTLLATGFGEELPKVRVAPAGPSVALAIAETRHPSLELFASTPGAFEEARFSRTADVLGTTRSDVLARFDSGAPALVATPIGDGRVAVFASDLANRWNDLVLQPAFVPFVGELVRWLGGARTPPASVIAGTSPMNGADRPGIVSWRPPGERTATDVAVNVDPREFDPARQGAQSFVAQVPTEGTPDAATAEIVARQQEETQGLWRYGLGLMLLSLVVESLVGRRV
jgi:Aerotolerance regulator N-terminal/von Willebrand factor type A domain